MTFIPEETISAMLNDGKNLPMGYKITGYNVNMLEWAGLGALLLGIIVFSGRLMRRGLTSLDDHRNAYLNSMRETEKKLHEDYKNMAADERMLIMKAAVADLLRLEGNPAGWEAQSENRRIKLITPRKTWIIELLVAERSLKGSQRTLRGRSRWILSDSERYEEHTDPASLMRSLNSQLRGSADKDLPNLPVLRQKGVSRHFGPERGSRQTLPGDIRHDRF